MSALIHRYINVYIKFAYVYVLSKRKMKKRKVCA